jgi:hypothetical protein
MENLDEARLCVVGAQGWVKIAKLSLQKASTSG